MSRNPLLIDGVVAVVLVALVLILEPGLAIAAILALILVVVCGVSLPVGRRRRERGIRAVSSRRRDGRTARPRRR